MEKKINIDTFKEYCPDDRSDGLPEVMNLSGGRSSAYTLMSLIKGGFGKSDNHYTIFENMGKEDETCYKFLHDIQQSTGIKLTWLEFKLTDKFKRELFVDGFSYDSFNNCEYSSIEQILNVEKLREFKYEKSLNNFWYKYGYSDRKDNIREVDYFTASRNGMPFADLFIYKCAIRVMKGEGLILPSVGSRWCTGDGKEKVGDRWLALKGIREFISYKGMRFDEPDRVRKVFAKNDKQNSIWYDCPLHWIKVSKIDVLLAWGNQSIDLGIQPDLTNCFKDVIGNCDFCHLKKKIKKLWLIQNGFSASFFKQIETLCNNYNGDIDAMSRTHGTYEMLESIAALMDKIPLESVLSDEEVEVSCFGCGD